MTETEVSKVLLKELLEIPPRLSETGVMLDNVRPSSETLSFVAWKITDECSYEKFATGVDGVFDPLSIPNPDANTILSKMFSVLDFGMCPQGVRAC